MKQIQYFRDKCIGCGACVIKAPHIWEMNMTDGKADLLDAEEKGNFHIRILWDDEVKIMNEIVAVCPVKAIKTI